MQRQLALLTAAWDVDHYIRLFAKTGVQGVGQQNGRNTETFCLAQSGLPFPVRGFLRHHNQDIAALKRQQLLCQPDAGLVKRIGRHADAAKQTGGVFGKNTGRADAENRHLPRLHQYGNGLGNSVAIRW